MLLKTPPCTECLTTESHPAPDSSSAEAEKLWGRSQKAVVSLVSVSRCRGKRQSLATWKQRHISDAMLETPWLMVCLQPTQPGSSDRSPPQRGFLPRMWSKAASKVLCGYVWSAQSPSNAGKGRSRLLTARILTSGGWVVPSVPRTIGPEYHIPTFPRSIFQLSQCPAMQRIVSHWRWRGWGSAEWTLKWRNVVPVWIGAILLVSRYKS